MTKKQLIRIAVYDKYGGRCAYTGKVLGEDWQIDHKTPRASKIWEQTSVNREKSGYNFDVDDIPNLLPALYIVNHYKRCLDLESFRQYMLNFHIRLARLPKKTRVLKSQRRVEYMNRVADAFDITPDKPFSGKFYFETIEVENANKT